MNRHAWCSGFILLAIAVSAIADDKKPSNLPAKAKVEAFEKLKKLAGDWVAQDAQGKPTATVVSSFKVTAAGSAVHETIFPGTGHEMVSVYHMDGPELVMTHYCAQGNQPQMKAVPDGSNQLRFNFLKGANIDPAKDMHMHEGSITFVDGDHIVWSWVGYANGKPADDHKVSMKLVRKK